MKKLKTLKIEDQGQDFIKLDIMENGIIRGYSIMFAKERLALIGIGTLDGKKYYTLKELKEKNFSQDLQGLTIYMKESHKPDPLPWNAMTLNYKII